MIEITHFQARRWIRESHDVSAGGRALPDEQWTALQAHLENCPECRSFREQWVAADKSISRSLSRRWGGIPGPSGNIFAAVLENRQNKAHQQRLFLRFVVPLLAGLIFITAGIIPRYSGTISEPTLTPAPTPTLTPAPVGFSGVVAFAAETAVGDSDIFLLTISPGLDDPELINISQHPASDRHPTWSPDGQWLAFLSDRDGQPGQYDLYVINVAGTRLIRMTHLANGPGPAWIGPLSWSADGRWIAGLVRRPNEQGSWIYRVALDGGPPLLLGGPSASGQVRFSPRGPLLAYQSGPDQTGLERIEVFNAETGALLQLTQAESTREGMRAGKGSAFDWSVDGRSLTYISEGPYNNIGLPTAGAVSMIRMSIELHEEQFILYKSADNLRSVHTHRPGAYRSVTLGPRDELVFLQDPDDDGCWTIFTRPAYMLGDISRELPDLCIQAGGEAPGLDRSNWDSGRRWLVVPANLPDQPVGLYAIYIPLDGEAFRFERLSNADGLGSALRVRPARPNQIEASQSLQIDPHPSGTLSGSKLPGLLPPAELLDRLLLVEEGLDGSAIMRGAFTSQALRNPPSGSALGDGSELQTGVKRVLAGQGYNTCPTWSPDGQTIAYLSDIGNIRARLKEVYLMDSAGTNAVRLTWLPFQTKSEDDPRLTSPPGFECPVWSPDGKRLTAIVRSQSVDYLAIIPVERQINVTGNEQQASLKPAVKEGVLVDGAGTRYIPVDPLPSGAVPRWTPDSQRILVPALETLTRSGSIQVIDPETPGKSTILFGPGDWQAVTTPIFSPSGRWMAYAALNLREHSVQVQMRIADSSGYAIRQWVGLPAYQAEGLSMGNSQITWWGLDTFTGWPNPVPSGRLGLVVRDSPVEEGQATLLVYYPNPGVMHILARVNETLYDTVWSEDGEWVVYSTQSGLWAINIPAALMGDAGPARLSSTIIFDIALD